MLLLPVLLAKRQQGEDSWRWIWEYIARLWSLWSHGDVVLRVADERLALFSFWECSCYCWYSEMSPRTVHFGFHFFLSCQGPRRDFRLVFLVSPQFWEFLTYCFCYSLAPSIFFLCPCFLKLLLHQGCWTSIMWVSYCVVHYPTAPWSCPPGEFLNSPLQLTQLLFSHLAT